MPVRDQQKVLGWPFVAGYQGLKIWSRFIHPLSARSAGAKSKGRARKQVDGMFSCRSELHFLRSITPVIKEFEE